MKNHLIISEDFYSIQGEGFCSGHPAVFLRLSGCNLDCDFCDSKQLWTKGKKYSFTQILDKWHKSGWLSKLQSGAHLVITGGEPLLQQDFLWLFIQKLDKTLKLQTYIELETNATILLNNNFLQRINQVNASPKLVNDKVLLQLSKLNKTKFKFVIKEKNDLDYILNNYVTPFKIKRQNICLMPEGKTREAIREKSAMVVELCKKYMLNFSPRLQINIGIK